MLTLSTYCLWPQIVLLGNADEIVQHLSLKLGWELPELPARAPQLDAPRPNLRKRASDAFVSEPRRVANRCAPSFAVLVRVPQR